MIKEDSVILEKLTPFSKSKIWAVQRSYYEQQGIDAWKEEVPFYVTSNPFIANSYANVVIRFIQDWIRQNPEAINHPFYIVEIGVGTGQFSFYMLKRLTELKDFLDLDVQLCYIMTDFTEKNLQFWQQHPALTPYIESNMLDFSQLDFENDDSLQLLNSDQHLQAGSVTNPLITFANYLFDSIVADVFNVKEGQLSESLVKLSTQTNNLQNDEPTNWEKVNINYEQKTIDKNHYNDPALDQVLSSYKDTLKNTHLHFPIGSLQGISRLAALSNQKMLLLASDKGYVTLNELEDLDFPELAFHGSFSLMVNFHAIAEYFKVLGGHACLQQPFDGFATGVFLLGANLNEMPKTQVVVTQQVNGFCPGHYFCMYEHMEKTHKTADLPALASFLTLSCWDPGIFEMFSERISEIIDESDQDVVDYITLNLSKVTNNFYYIPDCFDILFDIAVLYHELGLYQQAIDHYKQSAQFFPDNYEINFNLGYCYFHLQQYEFAKPYFEQALNFQPKSRESIDWLRNTNKKINS